MTPPPTERRRGRPPGGPKAPKAAARAANRPQIRAADDDHSYIVAMALAYTTLPRDEPKRKLTLHFVLGAFVALLEDRAASDPTERGRLAAQLEDGSKLAPGKLIATDNQKLDEIEKKIARWRERPDDWAYIEGLEEAFLMALKAPVWAAEELALEWCGRVGDSRFFVDICQPWISRRPGWQGAPIPFKRISVSSQMAALLIDEFHPKI